MTSDESYKSPVYLCRDPRATAMDTFAKFAEQEFPGREWDRLSCGGYRFRYGERIYRVTLYGPMSAARWGVYIDFDAMKGVTA